MTNKIILYDFAPGAAEGSTVTAEGAVESCNVLLHPRNVKYASFENYDEAGFPLTNDDDDFDWSFYDEIEIGTTDFTGIVGGSTASPVTVTFDDGYDLEGIEFEYYHRKGNANISVTIKHVDNTTETIQLSKEGSSMVWSYRGALSDVKEFSFNIGGYEDYFEVLSRISLGKMETYTDFDGDIVVYEEIAADGCDCPACSCDFTVITDNPPTKGQDISVYSDDIFFGKFRVSNVTRQAQNIYTVQAESSITALDGVYIDISQYTHIRPTTGTGILDAIEAEYPSLKIDFAQRAEEGSYLDPPTDTTEVSARQILAMLGDFFDCSRRDNEIGICSSGDAKLVSPDKVFKGVEVTEGNSYRQVNLCRGDTQMGTYTESTISLKNSNGIKKVDYSLQYYTTTARNNLAKQICKWSSDSEVTFEKELEDERVGNTVTVLDDYGESHTGKIVSIEIAIGYARLAKIKIKEAAF